ncbi:EAL and HDOD domain-containing protein [Ketobacter sp.]
MEIYLARQPVFDRDMVAIAYELLFRSGNVAHAIIDDPNAASMKVLANAFSEIGLDTITSGKPALVNITHDILAKGDLPKGLHALLIPEVLETVVVNGDVISEVENLVELGYKVALDDFEYSEAWKPLLQYADYIKLDVMALGVEGVEAQLKLLKASGVLRGKLVAEKIETYEEFEIYKAMGFDYFQGYFLCKPHLVVGKSIPASQQVLVSLLGELGGNDYDVDKVSSIIAQDPRLSYKLLRVVNSAAFGLPRRVTSIEDTVVFLGANELRRWAGMLALAGVDNKPNELLLTGIKRAKMCEFAAKSLKRSNPGSYFAAGLLSVLDALLDQPLDLLMKQMPLSPELEQALLEGGGELGQILYAVIAYDEGRFDKVSPMGLDANQMWEMYLDAVQWAEKVSQSMSAPH